MGRGSKLPAFWRGMIASLTFISVLHSNSTHSKQTKFKPTWRITGPWKKKERKIYTRFVFEDKHTLFIFLLHFHCYRLTAFRCILIGFTVLLRKHGVFCIQPNHSIQLRTVGENCPDLPFELCLQSSIIVRSFAVNFPFVKLKCTFLWYNHGSQEI